MKEISVNKIYQAIEQQIPSLNLTHLADKWLELKKQRMQRLLNIYQFLKFMFENHPPLQDNSVTQKFKSKYPDLQITSVREYMGIMLFEKTKE